MTFREKSKCRGCGQPILTNQRFCPFCGQQTLNELEVESILNYGRCPACGMRALRVIKSAKPWRYIECDKCFGKFKSLETFAIGTDYLKNTEAVLRFIDKY